MISPRPLVVTFGEVLMRLGTPHAERLSQATRFEFGFTGCEVNAGVSLVNFGDRCRLVTTLPESILGEACIQSLRGSGVELDHVKRAGSRLGIFYLESGASQRPSQVLYDRAGSSFASSVPGDFDWGAALAEANWFHFSAITPALGAGVMAALVEALEQCVRLGVPVSCDVNFRSALWGRPEARSVLERLLPFVTVLIGPFAVFEPPSQDGRVVVARSLMNDFGIETVAYTSRHSHSASHNTWQASIIRSGTLVDSSVYDIAPIVDRVGSGDAFSGALIHGLLHGWDDQRIVEFAAAASCLKHSIRGDFNRVSESEVEHLLKTGGHGHIQR